MAAAAAGAGPPPEVQKTGYAGFGSFHSDDVEQLVRQGAAAYSAPPLPFGPGAPDPEAAAEAAGAELRAAGFGTSAARSQFLVDFDRWTFINHGAFGGVAAAVYAAADAWRRHCERQPLAFIDRELFPHLVRVIREVAAFVNCRPQDLVLLPNATAGLNSVIQSCGLGQGDVAFSLDIGYGSVKKMLQAACEAAGATQAVGRVVFPLSGPEDILSVVERSMPPGTKLAVFDAVTSNTALVLPVHELVQLCRSRGVPVLIDGAHALGQLPVDLSALQADFFVTNAHKWLCGARGSALLYASPRWQAQLRPPVLSHGAEAGFLSRFIWAGCADYAPLLALAAAVRWWRALGAAEDEQEGGDVGPSAWGRCAHAGDGGGAARRYAWRLARAAADALASRWGTGCLAPPSMTAAMALVRLPAGGALPAPGAADSADAKFVQDLLHHRHHIEVPIKAVQGDLYVRISAHIYNTREDYEALGAAVEALQQQQQQGGARAAAEEQRGSGA